MKITPLKLIFITEIVTIFLIAFGILPREVALFLTGALIFYIIFSPLKDALVLTIASIPFYVALPVSESFDSMANWRVILVVLFSTLLVRAGVLTKIRKAITKPRIAQLCWLPGKQVSSVPRLWKDRIYSVITQQVSSFQRLTLLFLGIGTLSIINATDITAGIKKLLFLINIFLLYIVIRNKSFLMPAVMCQS